MQRITEKCQDSYFSRVALDVASITNDIPGRSHNVRRSSMRSKP